MKRAPKEKKSNFDIDRFIGGAATVQADTAPVSSPGPQPVETAPAEAPATEAPAAEVAPPEPAPKAAARRAKSSKQKAAKPKTTRSKSAKTPAKAPKTPVEPTPADMIRTSFDLPKTLQKRLKVGAVIKGVPMRDLVEDAIRQYLDRENLPEAP